MECFEERKLERWEVVLWVSRGLRRELIYWPTELAVGLILLIYVLQVQISPEFVYFSRDDALMGERLRLSSEISNAWNCTVSYQGKEVPFGIDYPLIGNNQTSFRVSMFPTDLLNREYGWVCLIWMIKHTGYLADWLYTFFYEKKYKKLERKVYLYDSLTHILNILLYILWTLYSFLLDSDDIHIGMYTRYRISLSKNRPMLTQQDLSQRDENIRTAESLYESKARWTWLYIPTGIIFLGQVGLFVLGVVKSRSSLYTGQGVGGLIMPLQLFFLHLFFKGWWIGPNTMEQRSESSIVRLTIDGDTISTLKSYYDALEYVNTDYFEARWVFWPAYLLSFTGLILSPLSLLRACQTLKFSRILGLKYFLQAVLSIILLILALTLDNTLYHYYYQKISIVRVALIIGIIVAAGIGIISIWEKKVLGEGYYSRHNDYDKWSDETYLAQHPHWTRTLPSLVRSIRPGPEPARQSYLATIPTPHAQPAPQNLQ